MAAQKQKEREPTTTIDGDGNWWCLGCDTKYTPPMPQPIWAAVALMKAFHEEHKRCKAPKKRPNPATAAEWRQGPDTGTSSIAIWEVMEGQRSTLRDGGFPPIPHDPSDFGRCYRLLQLCPHYRPRLAEVAEGRAVKLPIQIVAPPGLPADEAFVANDAAFQLAAVESGVAGLLWPGVRFDVEDLRRRAHAVRVVNIGAPKDE